MLEFMKSNCAVRNSFMGYFGCLCCNLRNKLYCDVYEAGNDYEIRIHKVEPMLVIGCEQ